MTIEHRAVLEYDLWFTSIRLILFSAEPNEQRKPSPTSTARSRSCCQEGKIPQFKLQTYSRSLQVIKRDTFSGKYRVSRFHLSIYIHLYIHMYIYEYISKYILSCREAMLIRQWDVSLSRCNRTLCFLRCELQIARSCLPPSIAYSQCCTPTTDLSACEQLRCHWGLLWKVK